LQGGDQFVDVSLSGLEGSLFNGGGDVGVGVERVDVVLERFHRRLHLLHARLQLHLGRSLGRLALLHAAVTTTTGSAGAAALGLPGHVGGVVNLCNLAPPPRRLLHHLSSAPRAIPRAVAVQVEFESKV
jgi:hypothetical protein